MKRSGEQTEVEVATAVKVAVVGHGADAAQWERLLRGEGALTQHIDAASGDDLADAITSSDAHAVAIVSHVPELPALMKRIVMARKHVFVTPAPPLSAKEFRAIEDFARRRDRFVLFDTPALEDEHVAFVKRMVGGPAAIWQPLYVRALRTGPGSGQNIGDLVIGQIALVMDLAGGMPSGVSALSPRTDDESGSGGCAMITLAFDGGRAARIDVSLVEPEPRQECVLACEGRTIVLDALDARSPLRIEASGRSRRSGPAGWAETVSEHPVEDVVDRATRVASAFVAAVQGNDASMSNAATLAAAARVWETARESMSRGGEMLRLDSAPEHQRPVLQLIQGGGHASEGHSAPALRVVARR